MYGIIKCQNGLLGKKGGGILRIIGIDPGYAIVGYGAVESVRGNHRMLTYGAITTPAHRPMDQRLHEIFNDMLKHSGTESGEKSMTAK